MQQSVARGVEAAGSNQGGTGMAFMGMGVNAAGGMMQGMQQNNAAAPNPFIQTSQGQQASSEQPAENPYDKLTEMKKLLDNGVITQADFDAAKAKILGL
jgi:membrane protease subunit (stomatin/prohibitin family)